MQSGITNREAIAKARGLVKEFGSYLAVDGIDFDIPRGSCFGFLGPNGAGKTTTLKMMLGLSPHSGGDLSLFGLDVATHSRDIRARVGVVPQADNLDPDFTVEENLHMYASYFGLPQSEVAPRVEHLLQFASLEERRQAKTETLSGGMKRRLTIARALINTPELVVLDEPTTGLDPQARHLIWARLGRLREEGTTLVLTTHYMEEAERLCDELVIMDHGAILDQGSPSELVQRHVEPEVIEIRGEAAPGFIDSAVETGCRVESIGSSVYCYTQEPSELLSRLQSVAGLVFLHRPSGLEDVFLKLTGRELRD